MSGTRSPFPKAQATDPGPRSALIVAHGQPSRPGPPEQALARLAVEVQERVPGWTIRSATMAAPGALEAALADLPDGATIYPLFMSKGWFVSHALRARLGTRDLVLTDPLGLDPALPDLGAQAIMAEAMRRNWPIGEVRVVLAAHGSGRSDKAAEAAYRFRDQLAAIIECHSIDVGFVEQAPSIAEAATDMGRTALCLPLFACDGDHVQDDIPSALESAGFMGHLMPVIGHHPSVPELIAASLRDTLHQRNAA
ncbi:sirohydrochlorin chelatase [Shimia biformata]|uniref:sirohydrochlorin chelatase n=1 Tax=Shimia biformata TaxID=1294299 RepID=UPI001950C1A7|nr:CbiX/SirB N-terminal domain-containing protein [Shimia biformata]